MTASAGKLYLVPTPIGNLADLSDRVRETLQQTDIVACEDTRHSGQLLAKLGLKKHLVSYHDFNETTRARQLIDRLLSGESIAVISDAGSPGISDPAYRIVKTAIDHNITIVPIPGPTSIIPALTASGLPTDRFFFEGFLPNKSGARRTRLAKLKDYPHTLIFFESPHRITKTLADMIETLNDRTACLAREITKLYEEFIRGKLSEIHAILEKRKVKGEIVLVVQGAGKHQRSSQESKEK